MCVGERLYAVIEWERGWVCYCSESGKGGGSVDYFCRQLLLAEEFSKVVGAVCNIGNAVKLRPQAARSVAFLLGGSGVQYKQVVGVGRCN